MQLYCNGNIFDLWPCLIILHDQIIGGEFIKILYLRIQFTVGAGYGFLEISSLITGI